MSTSVIALITGRNPFRAKSVAVESGWRNLLSRPGVHQAFPLSESTSIKIGGPAEAFVEPKSREELLEVLSTCHKSQVPFRILGRGSNMLIADEGIAGLVIRCTKAASELKFAGDRIRVGASVPLQGLISRAGRKGFGGIEFLHSVPGNVGGAIAMNAGRGKAFGVSIGNFVEQVEVFDGRRIRHFSLRNCKFGYRESIFQASTELTILSVILRLDRVEPGEVLSRIKERLAFVREAQDNFQPNAGSVYRSGFRLATEAMGEVQGGAQFSTKTQNWINNTGGATSDDVTKLIERIADQHKDRGWKPPVLEWIHWTNN